MMRYYGIGALVLFVFGFLCCGESPNKPNDELAWMVFTDMEPDWSPDGRKIAYTSGGDGIKDKVPPGLYIVDVATRQRELILEGAYVYGPRWSPDGDWIAVSIYQNIYKIRPNGDSLVQLTYGESEFDPSWSPDGNFIVFHRNLGKDGGIFITTSDGKSEGKLLKWALHPDWFPDSENLAVYAYDTLLRKSRIAKFFIPDSTLYFLTNDNTISKSYLRVSLDGKKILYTAMVPGKVRCLYTVDVHNRVVEKIIEPGYTGSWSPDGKYMAYNNPSDGAIYIRDLEVDTMIQISPGILIHEPDWDSVGFPRKGVGA